MGEDPWPGRFLGEPEIQREQVLSRAHNVSTSACLPQGSSSIDAK
jgi:hypothetical protein